MRVTVETVLSTVSNLATITLLLRNAKSQEPKAALAGSQ